MESTSKRWTINSIDWKKIGVGALIAMGGALLTYVVEVFGNIDFGQFAVIVIPAFGILVNFLRKLISNYSKK